MTRRQPAAYTDFQGAYDGIAPPAAVVGEPVPVVQMAALNPLANQIFEGRGVGTIINSLPDPAPSLLAIGGGGLLVEMVWWEMQNIVPPGEIFLKVEQVRDTSVTSVSTGATIADIGGVPVFAGLEYADASLVDWTGAVSLSRLADELPVSLLPALRTFVPAGGALRIGNETVSVLNAGLKFYIVWREVPVSPRGF